MVATVESIDTPARITNRQRRLMRRGPKAPRHVASKIPAETKKSDEVYLRRIARMEKQRKTAERLCIRHKLTISVRFLDYRYWQCRSCGFNPLIPAVWSWWTYLHYRQREEIHAMSRDFRPSNRLRRNQKHRQI